MIETSSLNLERLEAAVTEAESHTAAEFVVVIARRSGSYTDLEYLGGSVLAFFATGFVLIMPLSVNPLLLLLDLVMAFITGLLVVRHLPSLKRYLAGTDRLRDQCSHAAERTMHTQGITLTKDRECLLVYISLFEKRIDFIADVGLDAAVSLPKRNAILHTLRLAIVNEEGIKALTEAIGKLGQLCGKTLPQSEDTSNEIPNSPIIIDG